MDEDAFAVLTALKSVNDALLEGLKDVIFILENESDISPERRDSLIAAIKGLIKQGEEAYGIAIIEH